MLLVDAGNILFTPRKSERLLEQDKVKARGIISIYKRLGYQAMAVGPQDLIDNGELVAESYTEGAPWTSANLIDEEGMPLVAPWRKVEIAGLTVGIIALTGETLQAGREEHYKISDWEDGLKTAVNQLKEQCDLIVLLSTLKQEENKRIATTYPKIALLLSSVASAGNVPPYLIGNSLLSQTHSKGKYLGILDLEGSMDDGWQSMQPPFAFRFLSLGDSVEASVDIENDIAAIRREMSGKKP